MSGPRLIRRLVAPILTSAALAGCGQSPTDGAPVDAEAVGTPVPAVNPQGMLRSLPIGGDED